MSIGSGGFDVLSKLLCYYLSGSTSAASCVISLTTLQSYRSLILVTYLGLLEYARSASSISHMRGMNALRRSQSFGYSFARQR